MNRTREKIKRVYYKPHDSSHWTHNKEHAVCSFLLCFRTVGIMSSVGSNHHVWFQGWWETGCESTFCHLFTSVTFRKTCWPDLACFHRYEFHPKIKVTKIKVSMYWNVTCKCCTQYHHIISRNDISISKLKLIFLLSFVWVYLFPTLILHYFQCI